MANLARSFSIIFDQDVVDKTGLTGMFDLHFDSPDGSPVVDSVAPTNPADGDGGIMAVTSFQTPLQKLGLKLEPAKGSGEFLVIDHVEKPSEN
jgi:uncharacterized protein (TIGR03435 family)